MSNRDTNRERVVREGREAAEAGRSWNDNPYDDHSVNFWWWHDGYWGWTATKEASNGTV